ncbi:MAG: DUF2934 domain-containing protein [Verrucomicrobiota bacterium]|nr:DUF2934 domain-containing protein [Verrucomicrobiota bacterium]
MKPRTNQKGQARNTNPTRQISTEQIQKRAYQLYVNRVQEPGHELEDWLQAERVVTSANFLIDAEAKVQGALKSW